MMVINRGFLAKTSTFDTPQHRTQFYVSLGIAIQNIGYSILSIHHSSMDWFVGEILTLAGNHGFSNEIWIVQP